MAQSNPLFSATKREFSASETNKPTANTIHKQNEFSGTVIVSQIIDNEKEKKTHLKLKNTINTHPREIP